MDDVTDTVFRQVITTTARPDLFFTEFVNVDGLQSPGRAKLLKKLRCTKNEVPLVAQIWGKNPDNFYKTVRELRSGELAAEANKGESAPGTFVGVDINMGCPVRTVIKQGCCSALIDNRGLAGEIIAAVREAAGSDFAVSVKTRLGTKSVDMSWVEFLLDKKLNMLTIHGRTAKDMSKVPADWSAIGRARTLRDKLSPATLLVGNGDVLTRQQGEELARHHKLDGIMIGRGVFYDPFVFASNSPWADYNRRQRIDLYRTHVELFRNTWGATADTPQNIRPLNKFCKIYIQGFDGAKELREKLMYLDSTDALLAALRKMV